MGKKVLIFTLLFAFLAALVSCGKGNPTNRGEVTKPAPNIVTEQEKVGALHFAVMADCRGVDVGINLKAVEKTLQNIKKITPQPLFLVMPGDLVEGAKSYSEIKSQLLHFKETITKYYPISFFYPGFGNHEATAGAEGEKAFQEVFSEIHANFLEGFNNTVYYFDKYNTRFYMLNSDHPGEIHIISDVQLNFIKQNSDPEKMSNLYFFHEPAYPTGPHIGSSLDANKLQRDKFWEIIDISKNPMAFCGHEHFYTRRHINSDFDETVDSKDFKFSKLVYQVTTGTFGAPTYTDFIDKKNVDVPPIPEYHFAMVDVYEDKIKVTVYNLDGKIIDQFES